MLVCQAEFSGEKISVCSYYLYDYDSTAYDFDSKIKIVSAMGLADTLAAVIVPNFISISVTFFLRQSFLSFPDELEDAAKIDGCSLVRIFIIYGISIIQVGNYSDGDYGIVICLNDLLWPTIAITSEKNRVLSMFIALARGSMLIMVI